MHRVIDRSPRDRHSIVFFFYGNANTELRTLDGSKKDAEDPLTVERHMTRRLRESYGKGKQSGYKSTWTSIHQSNSMVLFMR